MKKYFILFVALAALGFSSCSSGKMVRSSVAPAEIKELMVLEPLTYISGIWKGSEPVMSDSLSVISRDVILSSLNSNGRLPRISETIIFQDESILGVYAVSTQDLVNRLLLGKKGGIVNITIPPEIRALMGDERFGIIICAEGFSRSSKNYTNQMLKGLGIGILTLGTYVEEPIKARTNMYVIILDNERNEVAYFNHSDAQNEPVSEKHVGRQLDKLLKKYFK